MPLLLLLKNAIGIIWPIKNLQRVEAIGLRSILVWELVGLALVS